MSDTREGVYFFKVSSSSNKSAYPSSPFLGGKTSNEMILLPLGDDNVGDICDFCVADKIERLQGQMQLLIKSFNIMPHFTCVRSTRNEVETHIKEIENLKIENILALRGDIPEDKSVYKKDFLYANELVSFIQAKTNLSIGVAGYPEGHIDAPDINTDIENLKKKVDAGADAIFTQLFYDNNKFFSYVERVRKSGIELPVIAGIMPILSAKQMERITSMAKITIPQEIKKNLEKFKDSPDDLKNFGIEYVSRQCRELLKNNVAGLHFYTLNKAYSTSKILDNIL